MTKKFEIPEVSEIEAALPVGTRHYLPYNDNRLTQFQDRSNPFVDKVHSLFFSGGRLNEDGFFWKDEYNTPDNRQKFNKYFRSLMGTFDSKHEHKTAMCAWALSQVMEYRPHPKKAKAG